MQLINPAALSHPRGDVTRMDLQVLVGEVIETVPEDACMAEVLVVAGHNR